MGWGRAFLSANIIRLVMGKSRIKGAVNLGKREWKDNSELFFFRNQKKTSSRRRGVIIEMMKEGERSKEETKEKTRLIRDERLVEDRFLSG